MSADKKMLWFGPVDATDTLLQFTCIVDSVDGTNSFISSPAVLIVLSKSCNIIPLMGDPCMCRPTEYLDKLDISCELGLLVLSSPLK